MYFASAKNTIITKNELRTDLADRYEDDAVDLGQGPVVRSPAGLLCVLNKVYLHFYNAVDSGERPVVRISFY